MYNVRITRIYPSSWQSLITGLQPSSDVSCEIQTVVDG